MTKANWQMANIKMANRQHMVSFNNKKIKVTDLHPFFVYLEHFPLLEP